MIEAEAMWDGIWLGATLAAPLLLLAVSFLIPAKALKKLLPLAPLPGLIAAVFLSEGAFIAFPDMVFGLVLYLDASGSLLLGASAILWIAAGIYANAYRRETENDTRFVRWWLATLTGSLGVFLAADLPGFYLFFTMVSLSAYWLIVDDGTASVRRAGLVYVSLALLGEAFLLFAFILLAATSLDGSLLIYDAMVALPSSPFRDIVIALVILGFGIKIGLVPLHVWMPLTYSAAPIPAAAVFLGLAFLLCTLVVAGLPPLSGFLGKLAMLTALLPLTSAVSSPLLLPTASTWIFFALLIGSGLLALIALTRAGIRHFWAAHERAAPEIRLTEGLAIAALTALVLALTIHAPSALQYTSSTAADLHNPQGYIDAVLQARPIPNPGAAGQEEEAP